MKVVLHVGYPKTASSTFQFGLLKPLHESNRLILRTWRQDDPAESLSRRPSSRLFCRQTILPEYLEFSCEKLNVLSDESLTAPVRLRKINFGPDLQSPEKFPAEIKRQVQQIYGSDVEWTVLVCIRSQKDLIYSQYVEEYNVKRYLNIDLVFGADGEVDLNGYEIYRYAAYLKDLYATFGSGNVRLLIFEHLKLHFHDYCSRLADVFELSPEHVHTALKKQHVNKKTKSSDGYFTKGGEALIPFFTTLQREQIDDFYRDDNLELQEMLGSEHKLSQLGYYR